MINWHADGDGRCHEGCEQYGLSFNGMERCRLGAAALRNDAAVKGGPCPFAVLADVFRLHERSGKETT